MRSTEGDILRAAAADVDQRGVCRYPDEFVGETCLAVSLADREESFCLPDKTHAYVLARQYLGGGFLSRWNDAQVSRAVVAAEARSIADLADLLYGVA